MKLIVVLLAVIGCSIVLGMVPLAAQEEQDVRGAFLTSRPKEKPQSTNSVSRTSRRRPKAVVSAEPKNRPTPNPGPKTPTPIIDTSVKPNTQRVGLGLTLFMRDSNGLAVRTDPSHVFHKGDRVRVLLETNTDGYLYIFNTTNDGAPVMIYPQAELDEAGNYLQAHVPFEIPSSLASEERLRWLVFDEHAGDERLYFVFTREPLPGVPIEDDLVAFCKNANPPCPIRPTPDVWLKIQKQMNQPLQTHKSDRYGAPQTKSESTRGLGLATSDPEPSVIMMASSNTSTLVTSLNLVHN